jgi:hypothetical protein
MPGRQQEDLDSQGRGDLVLESHGKLVKIGEFLDGHVEETFETHGLLLGEKFSGEYTIEGRVRPEGTVHIDINGFILTEGAPLIQMVGIANGTTKPDGRTILRGANCYTSASGKFARLNEMAVMWIAEVDEEGNISSRGWEWK